MKTLVDDPGGPGSPAARKKQKTVPSPEEKKEKKNRNGGPTSKATRKTTLRRDGGENLSSWTYQGSVQGKVARRYRNTCRLVLQEYCQGVVRTDAFGEGDVSRRDGHGNGRDSRRVLRQGLYSSRDAWHRGSAEGKMS